MGADPTIEFQKILINFLESSLTCFLLQKFRNKTLTRFFTLEVEIIMAWIALGGAIVVVVITLVLLQKKSAEIASLTKELTLLAQERDEKSSALKELEEKFEEKMDAVVQSSIQKISHAEQAKEEAVQAAADNYEVAAETHARLKEKEALIKELQGN